MITKQDFKTVPDESDIAGVDRDLRFHPADLKRERLSLTAEDGIGFNESG